MVHLAHDGIGCSLQVALLGLILGNVCVGVGRDPAVDFVDLVQEGALLAFVDLSLGGRVVESMLEISGVSLESILGLDFLPHLLVLLFVFLGLLDQPLDFLLGETTLVVGDRDFGVLVSSFVFCLNVHDSIGIDLEADFNLRHSSGCRRDSIEVELSEQVVVSGHLSLSFEDLDQHSRLVVGIGGEDL